MGGGRDLLRQVLSFVGILAFVRSSVQHADDVLIFVAACRNSCHKCDVSDALPSWRMRTAMRSEHKRTYRHMHTFTYTYTCGPMQALNAEKSDLGFS